MRKVPLRPQNVQDGSLLETENYNKNTIDGNSDCIADEYPFCIAYLIVNSQIVSTKRILTSKEVIALNGE